MILVVGYGNTLRGDDGIGPVVALALAERNWPDVHIMAIQQLTPELAESLAAASAAMFIDAHSGPVVKPVTVAPLHPASVPMPTHSADPRCLLALARVLYGRAPPAWLVTVGGIDFGLRDTLSPAGRQHARAAQECVETLIRSLAKA